MSGLHLKEFSSVIEAVYDCAVDPEKWRAALPRIAALLDSQGSTFAVHDTVRGDGRRFYDYGLSESAVRAYFEIYAPLNPTIAATPMMQIGVPWTLRQMVPYGEYIESRFYKEWSKPNGQGDLMGVLALRAGTRIATHAISRLDTKRSYDEADYEIYRLLAPHICRALTISDALDLKVVTNQALETTLDGLSAGVYLVARDRRIVYLNHAARRQIDDGHIVTIVENRLLPVSPAALGALNQALADASADEAKTPSAGSSIVLTRSDGPGLIATVLPLERGGRAQLSRPFAAVAAIFVQDPQSAPPLPGEAFAKMYGLTPSELRLVLALAPGLQLQETADMLGVSLPTVKSHLARVFQKTGTSRQAELVALLLRSSPPAMP